jgi:hypothetical protein
MKEMRGPASHRRPLLNPGYPSASLSWRRRSAGSNGAGGSKSWQARCQAVSALKPLRHRTWRHLHLPRWRIFLVACSCDAGCPATNISGLCFLGWIAVSSSSARYFLSLVILIPTDRDQFGRHVRERNIGQLLAPISFPSSSHHLICLSSQFPPN